MSRRRTTESTDTLRKYRPLSLLIARLLLAGLVFAGHDSLLAVQDDGTNSKAEPQPATESRESTTLTGRIVYDGPPSQPHRFGDSDQLGESLIVSEEGGIANVVVWVRSSDVPTPPFNGPLPPTTIRAVDRRFEPHVLAFWNVAPLKLANDEDYGININWRGPRNSFSSTLRPGESQAFEIEAEQFPSQLTSNIHPWFEAAHVLPLAHPYFAVTDDGGRFEIKNLPRGDWEFDMWHERVGRLRTDRFPSGRFTWNVERGENALGDLRVVPETLKDGH